MPLRLLHNMSTMPTEVVLIRPAIITGGRTRFVLPAELAKSNELLRAALGVEDLRETIETETARLGLRGCALVSGPRDGETLPPARLLLALVVLSKSSNRIFLAAKTPLLDEETLSRELVSADPRLRGTP